MRAAVHVPPDAAPFARRIARRLAESARDAELAPLLTALPAVTALHDRGGPQVAVVAVRGARVEVADAPAPGSVGSGVVGSGVVECDASDLSGVRVVDAAGADPDRLAATLTRLLDGPPAPWPERARAFWARTRHRPGTPPSLRLRCAEDGAEVRLGAATGEPACEVQGSEEALVAYLRGDLPLLVGVLGDTDLSARGSLATLSVLQGNALAYVLEGD
jgi:hypothetical protein